MTTLQEHLRELPSVDEILSRLHSLGDQFPRQLIVDEVRRVLAIEREKILSGSKTASQQVEQIVERNLLRLASPSLRHVINATGVVLHTNLGRAPLSAFESIRGYSNLEFDLATGKRGKRDVHVAGLLERLIGKPAIVVNNNAAAVYLALNELAAGFEVIVSRGELIEIGDGFRIPDIMARSGAVLREVGTTNRTRIDDYRNAIGERTRLIMRVHPSNFHMEGFTARPTLSELSQLGRELSIPVYEDLGSGCLIDLRARGIDEPLVSESVKAGVNLISFSCDKLLGGPQAGILAGDAGLVSRLRRNPMFRAFRLDKLMYETLETTLRHLLLGRWTAIPTLAMIFATADEIRSRAEKLVSRLEGMNALLIPGKSVIGGGSTPDQSLDTWLIAIEAPDVVNLEKRLRLGEPPVIARIEMGRLLVDLRTVYFQEEDQLAQCLRDAYRV